MFLLLNVCFLTSLNSNLATSLISPYFFNDVPHGHQFAVLCPNKQQFLIHRLNSCISVKMRNSFNYCEKKIQYKSLKSKALKLPVSNVDRNQIVEVQTAPLFHVRCAGSAEESPAHLWAGAGQKNCGELLPEAWSAVFKQLIRLIDDQPLHTEHRQRGQQFISFIFKIIYWAIFCLYETVHSGDRHEKQEVWHANISEQQLECYLLRSSAGGSCLRRKTSLFGVLTSISAQRNTGTVGLNSEERQIVVFFFCENMFRFLPYFLFDCGPYFLAAREALSMMCTRNPSPSDRRSSSLYV